MIHELNNPLSVFAQGHGEGLCLFIIDYGCMVNTCWVVKLKDGRVKHFDSECVRVYGNPTYNHDLIPDIPADWHPKPKQKRRRK